MSSSAERPADESSPLCTPTVARGDEIFIPSGSNGRSSTAGATLQPADANTSGNARPAPLLAGPPEKKQKAELRVAAKHAALAKQAVGTKKLTSFFTKK